MAPMLKELLAIVGAMAAGVALAAVTVYMTDDSYTRGYLAGRKHALEALAAKRPAACMSWWFQGDPVQADRHLRAACAARKKRK